MINYLTIAIAAFLGFILGAAGLLFLTKKGRHLVDAIKASDHIDKLNREITVKDERIELLEEQNSLLSQENEALKRSLQEMKEDYEKLVDESKARDKKIKGMEFILQENNKAIKALSQADRDLEEWKDMVFEALNQFTDLEPTLIEKLTDRSKRKPGEKL